MSNPEKIRATPDAMRRASAAPSGGYVPPNTQLARVLAALMAPKEGVDAELRRKMAIVVRHLHAMLDELQLGEPDLIKVYDFLDRVGSNKDMMLLGDHLGLSMRANDIAYFGPKGTAPNVIGPLYREDAPFMSNPGEMVGPDEPGRKILLCGQVRDCDSKAPLAGAVLDFWQSSKEGFYAEQVPTMPDYHFRRRIRTDAQGRYAFRTIMPGGYHIANRGTPVVELTEPLGLGSFRPPHIHLMADSDGYRHLTTLIYFEGDPANPDDCIFSARPENMARLEADPAGGPERCVFDIELVRD